MYPFSSDSKVSVLVRVALSLLALTTMGCDAPSSKGAGGAEETLQDRAQRLAHEILIIDAHVDVPYRLDSEAADLSRQAPGGDFDYPRARAGGLDASFMSIYVPASFQEGGGAKDKADALIDLVEGMEQEHPDLFAIARTPAEVVSIVESGRLALPLGMENGAPMEGDLANLRHFAERGISYITLTHSENNAIADSSFADERQWGGLSPFGRDLVAEMNRLGIMIDISHVSDEAFYEVLEVTEVPVIASHSSCRHFTPGFERNISDDMIRALADGGGVVHINFGSMFLLEKANREATKLWTEIADHLEANGIAPESAEAGEFRRQYMAEHPITLADVSAVADHIDHVAGLVGVEHVGIGSDFDGVGPTTPRGLEDVSRYPNLIRILLERGYSDDEIRMIFGENTLRVWNQVRAKAAA